MRTTDVKYPVVNPADRVLLQAKPQSMRFCIDLG
jgi:hypothetical protein